MPEYLAPGVYVEEVSNAAKSIQGVGTSTAGFVGPTERGPEGAVLVTSLTEFGRVFGGSVEGSYLPESVAGFFGNGGGRCYVARVVGERSQTAELSLPRETGRPLPGKRKSSEDVEGAEPVPLTPRPVAVSGEGTFEVKARGPGAWGNRIAVQVRAASVQPAGGDSTLFGLVVAYWATEPPSPLGDPTGSRYSRPPLLEVFDNLSTDPKSPRYYARQLDGGSNLVTLNVSGPVPTSKEFVLLEGGSDSSIVVADYKGREREDVRTGFNALAAVDEVAIVCVPDHGKDDLQGLTEAVQEHCEGLGDRFAVLAAPNVRPSALAAERKPIDSKYAAYYYPWLKINGPGGRATVVPPIGHVAGIYARTDAERGVHKAPANEVVRGALELSHTVTQGDQDILNPKGVNCIRSFPSRGIRVWGARTLSSDPEWMYVNVRRLMIYLEESIDESTQWVVFEPNDSRLWSRVRQGVQEFLYTEWRNGALMGSTPEEAFFVRCDVPTTMTQADIDNGRLIVEVGVAPVRPAEFVIFRIAQWKGGE